MVKNKINMDYYRNLAEFSSSLSDFEFRKTHAEELFPVFQIKSEFGEIDRDLYEFNKSNYSENPLSWKELVDLFGSEDSLRTALENYVNPFNRFKESNPLKIYIASGFFNDEDRKLVSFMEKFLESRGYQVYSPSRDGIVLTPDATAEDRLNTYHDNVKNVFDCDIMIMCVNTKDTGTSVECGLKAAQLYVSQEYLRDLDPDSLYESENDILNMEHPRIISFSDNGSNVNIMLLGAVLKHCGSWRELSTYLDYVDEVGFRKAKRDTSSIQKVKVY